MEVAQLSTRAANCPRHCLFLTMQKMYSFNLLGFLKVELFFFTSIERNALYFFYIEAYILCEVLLKGYNFVLGKKCTDK